MALAQKQACRPTEQTKDYTINTHKFRYLMLAKIT